MRLLSGPGGTVGALAVACTAALVTVAAPAAAGERPGGRSHGHRPPPAPSFTYTLPGAAVFPEGVTARGRTFYVSSTTDGTIFRGRLDRPAAEVFLPGNQDGRTTAVGLEAARGWLFVAGGATGQVFVYDLGTRGLSAATPTAAPPRPRRRSSTTWR